MEITSLKSKILAELTNLQHEGLLTHDIKKALVLKYLVKPLSINDFKRLDFKEVVIKPNHFNNESVYLAKINLTEFGNYYPEFFYSWLIFGENHNGVGVEEELNNKTKLYIEYKKPFLQITLAPIGSPALVFDNPSEEKNGFEKRLDFWISQVEKHNQMVIDLVHQFGK